MIKKTYYYLFYIWYRLGYKAQKEDSWFLAIIILSASALLYILSITALLGKLDIIHIFPDSKIYVIIILIAIVIIHYFIFGVNKKYEKLVEEFRVKRIEYADVDAVVATLYFAFSIILLIMIASFRKGYL